MPEPVGDGLVTLARSRRRRRVVLLPVSLAVVVVGVATPFVLTGGHGGSPGPPDPAGPARSVGTAPVAYTGRLESLRPGSVTPADLGAADRAFGLTLLRDVCTTQPTANTVLAPASAAQALGILQTGARGATRTALSMLLHDPAYGPDLLAAQRQRTAALRQVTGVTISNRVFTQAGLAPQQATLDDLRTGYDAQLQTLDFAGAPTASTEAINHLVSDDTRGLIPSLLDQSLDPSTVTVLTNAIYLKASWQQAFQSSVPEPFTTAGGALVQVPTLRSQESLPSATVGGWTSVGIPYSGGQLTAYALLPPAGAATCALPTPSTLTGLLTPTAPVTALLPQFHLQQTNHLLTPLAREGLNMGGDYSGISPGDLTDVIQKVDISLDRNGTIAAAATGGVLTTSAQVGVGGTVTFDRPFLLLVADTATHTPLFLTRVADPRG